jgi:hypothetical protein
MILRFTDDYVNYINEGLNLIGRIQNNIATREPYLGNIKELDILYTQSIVITALVDHLNSDNNATPEDNEELLYCLKSIISKNIC